jgi:uncharacterized protein (DUF1330 family)
MANAYWIGRIDVHNLDGYQHYAAANPAIIKSRPLTSWIER